jgi:hypothetical protein
VPTLLIWKQSIARFPRKHDRRVARSWCPGGNGGRWRAFLDSRCPEGCGHRELTPMTRAKAPAGIKGELGITHVAYRLGRSIGTPTGRRAPAPQTAQSPIDPTLPG